MKKKLLALSVASVVAGHAAAVDLTSPTPTPAFTFASELVNTDSIAVANGGTVKSAAGFSISTGTSKYVRYDFGNFTLGAALTPAELTVNVAGTTETVSAGGLVGSDFVIFEVGAGTGDVTQTDTLDLNLAGTKVFLQDNVTANVTYAIYETANDALNEANVLASASGPQFAFKTALSFKRVAANPAPTKIDVTQDSVEFTSGKVNPVAAYDIAADTTLFITDGADNPVAVTYAGLVNPAKTTVVVEGDFSPTQDLTAGVPDGTFTAANVVRLAGAVACGAGTAATALDAASATIAGELTGTFTVCETVNGVSVIPEQTFSTTYTPVSANAAKITVGNVTVAGETHEKNGDTVDLDIMLTPTDIDPAGAYANVIRITNKSNITGDVFLTIYNDDGDSVSIDLGDIAGQTTSSLAGQASTNLINVNAIFAAAQLADPTFELTGGSRKLRAVISGEFAVIEAQNITVSTDATTFATF